MQSKFEELIQEYEADLQRIRNAYFPLIQKGVITGYNLYLSPFDYSKGTLFLNYLHSDLKPEDRHFQELSKILKSEGFLEERIIVNDELVGRQEIVEREADYITELNWEDPSNIRYFDFECKEISTEELINIKREIIGESFQYDLLLRVANKKELRDLIDLFKKYTSKFKLDNKGRIIKNKGVFLINKSQIYKSWAVPLLICTSTNKKKPERLYDFLTVNQFNIHERLADKKVILSMLVRSKTKNLQRILEESGIKLQFDKKYVLRVFINNYIDKIVG